MIELWKNKILMLLFFYQLLRFFRDFVSGLDYDALSKN
jgi:hypothetical protein